MKKTVKLPKKKRMDIFLQMTKTYSKVFKNHPLGFDSEKNAYGVEIIPELRQKSAEFKVELKEKGDKSKSKFHVILTMVNEASLTELMSALRAPLAHRDKPQFIMQMLEVMCQHTSSVRYERVGRNSFYSVDGEFDKPYYIGGGKTCILGFFASLKPAAWKDGSLLLNVDHRPYLTKARWPSMAYGGRILFHFPMEIRGNKHEQELERK
ncbi:protein argonaute-4 [Cherax quadricarinatus]|uniref:protein argonaute-4 n=1 Tax=Cherax quadricarinatus TaxID=27406 RepID=UPI00387ED010